MVGDWTDAGFDYCGSCNRRLSPARLLFKLIILYIILAVLAQAESQFRRRAIELTARIEPVGEVRRGGRHPQQCMLIRYHYSDPVTAKPRQNTVTVPKHDAPTGPTAVIEYISGEPPMTRLKSQARPILEPVFFWVNITLLSLIAGVIGWIAWEAHSPIPRSSERRVVLKKPKSRFYRFLRG